jgi:uncharacterized damage-inducible protein DinB
MSELTNLIEELKNIYDGDAWHGPSLMDSLKDITADQASARPISGHCIWELVLHITAWEEVWVTRIQGRAMTAPEDGDFPPMGKGEEGWQAAVARLDNAHRRLVETASRLTEEQLKTIVRGKDFDVSYLLHGAVRHNVYHSGQIRLLARAVSR